MAKLRLELSAAKSTLTRASQFAEDMKDADDKQKQLIEQQRQEIVRCKRLAPGIDIDLSQPALTEEDATGRAQLYKTVKKLATLDTANEMHFLTLKFSDADAAYFDAWRRAYFFAYLVQLRDARLKIKDLEAA